MTKFHQGLHDFARSMYARDVLATLVTRALGMGCAVASSILVARLLGVEGRGTLAVTATLSSIAAQFGNLGLHSANSYYAARDRAWLVPLLANSLVASLLLGAASAAALGALVWLWPSVAPLSTPLLCAALGSVPLSLAFLFSHALVLGLNRVRAYNGIDLIGAVTSFVALLLVFVLRIARPDVVFLAGLTGPALGLAVALRLLTRSANQKLRPSRVVLRDTLQYGFKAYLSCGFAFLVVRIDLLMVQYFVGMEQAGYYATAASLGNLLYVVPSVAAAVAFPRMATVQDAGERWQFTRRVALVTGVLLVPMSALAMLGAPMLIRLMYTAAFLPAVPPFRILAVAMIFYGVNGIVSTHLAALAFPWLAVHVWIIAMVVNVALNALWIPAHGLTGAAYASLISYALVLAIQLAYCLRMARRDASQA